MPAPVLPVAALVSLLAAITVTPDPVAFQLGPIPVFWYGVCYAVGLALAYIVITREARRRGLDARLVDNGIIIVAVVALIGGRLYHVIDQWHLYQDDLLKIVMPPYTGLGVYGGILTGTIAAVVVTKLWKQSFWKWTDVIAPGLFVMQAVGRLGNFFNQELYGPPTTLPWGIAIECEHRIVQYPCATYPVDTTFFQPLFLYESISGVVGAITLLWIARRWGARLRPGDLFLLFLVWYAIVRLLLETLRADNWTLFGIPTAMVVSALVIAFAVVVFAIRHRPGSGVERWGDPPVRDEDTYEADDETYEVDDEETVDVDDDEAAADVGAADAATVDGGGAADEPAADLKEGVGRLGDRDGGGDAARPAPRA
jgi:phosphatidylglycerol---prolipoprotein diacylglyceryl transferase